MHEHIFVLEPEALQNYGHVWGASYWDEDAARRRRDREAAGRQSRRASRRSSTATAPGLGRYIPRIQRINAEVDLNIVVATGIYAFLELPNFFGYRSVEAIAEFFVREIREGIDDTGVKAAFLKCCVEQHGLIGDIPRILGAIAIASRRDRRAGDGAHERGREDRPARARGADRRQGVDPGADRDRARRRQQRPRLPARDRRHRARSLGFDRFNIPFFNPDAQRIETLTALLAEGYGDRIHLGHDAACFYDFMVGDPNFADEKPDYLHIWRTILPALLDAGVTQEQIDEMTTTTRDGSSQRADPARGPGRSRCTR